jgi:hypothetical protein
MSWCSRQHVARAHCVRACNSAASQQAAAAQQIARRFTSLALNTRLPAVPCPHSPPGYRTSRTGTSGEPTGCESRWRCGCLHREREMWDTVGRGGEGGIELCCHAKRASAGARWQHDPARLSHACPRTLLGPQNPHSGSHVVNHSHPPREDTGGTLARPRPVQIEPRRRPPRGSRVHWRLRELQPQPPLHLRRPRRRRRGVQAPH